MCWISPGYIVAVNYTIRLYYYINTSANFRLILWLAERRGRKCPTRKTCKLTQCGSKSM